MRTFLLLALIAFAPAAVLHGASVHVFAAASLTDSLKEVAAAFEKQSADKIVFNFGASNFLERQIEAGAPADIFFSADEAQMNILAAKNLLRPATRRNLLSNSLVIVLANDSDLLIRSAKDLADPKVRRLALADPAGVPAGIYAKQYLEKLGLWTSLTPKTVPLDNVRAALAAVEAGNADAAIVYRTDAAISKKTKVAWEIPRAETPGIVYPISVLAESKAPDASQAFVNYLASTNGTAVFARFGFIVLLASEP